MASEWMRPVDPGPSAYRMPDATDAPEGEDLVAVGADLAPGTLLAAYRSGLFPMPVDPRRKRSQIAWYSPDPRGIIPLDGLRVSRSLRRSCQRYEVRRDTRFGEVVRRCADDRRPGRWINERIIDAYDELFGLGWAHSFETYDGDRLVGGLYGVRIDGLFAGESMFHDATDASKVALVALVDWLRATGGVLLDVQWVTDHLRSLGAIEVPRPRYLELVEQAVPRAPSTP